MKYLQIDPDHVDGSIFYSLGNLGFHLNHGIHRRLRYSYHVDTIDLRELRDEKGVNHLVVTTTNRTRRKSHLIEIG